MKNRNLLRVALGIGIGLLGLFPGCSQREGKCSSDSIGGGHWGGNDAAPDSVVNQKNAHSSFYPEQTGYEGKKFRGVHIVDKDVLMVYFKDGDVIFTDDAKGDCPYQNCNSAAQNRIVQYGRPLNTSAVAIESNWRITSKDDSSYGTTGRNPKAVYRKSKLNGMAQRDWTRGDFDYRHTMAHWIFLALPKSLSSGKNYTLHISPQTNTDIESETINFDIFNRRSEAVHVNLSGYRPSAADHAADLYIWMGDGGARDYSSFEGNTVYLFNVETQEKTSVGKVSFWKKNAAEAQGYNFIRSDVWNADFVGSQSPGVYRLAIEGVGASQDFIIGTDALFEPFRVSLLGYFYMRIGQDNMEMRPVPRRPLWIPGQDPPNCKVVVTNMHPYHPEWPGAHSQWDSPDFFSRYIKEGAPENPDAKGGHSDAADWDRHLAHVVNIYDMLLPYILTRGKLDNDATGIAESGNGIPDIIDEARYEVDFWLALRFQGGYGHGVTNPNTKTNVLYQGGNTAMAAWANAANAAMLAEAFRIAGNTQLMHRYLSAAKEAWIYATALSDQMLDDIQDIGESVMRGRDFRMTAAAWLYNLTGDSAFEAVISEESVVTGEKSEFLTKKHNQLYAMAAYLQTEREVHYSTLQSHMRAAVIFQARDKEVKFSHRRPSRRATDNLCGYFHTGQFVHRSILAHAVAEAPEERSMFERALTLEADWGLGRNPANLIQMTTATTTLQNKRSIVNAYTTGRNDGTPGMHPGHTPYMNLDDWAPKMIMGRPSWMSTKSYPDPSKWPRAELYFDTRYVWAHSEFTPRQTMRGKMALYGYLLGIAQ